MSYLSFDEINNLISEVYPFTFRDINTFKDKINFHYLSKNRNIKWDYSLIDRHKNDWHWESLGQNRAVFESLTLGLLFPDKVSLPVCSCYKKEDFCEDLSCSVNNNKFLNETSLYDLYPSEFVRLFNLCEASMIDYEILSEFYYSDKPEAIISVKRTSYK